MSMYRYELPHPTYNYHSELLTLPDDDYLIPTLVPPNEDEDSLIPQLIPPSPQSPITIVEIPIEVYVEIPVELPFQTPQSHLQETVPQYILNGYIESLVTRVTTCPITMLELTLENTRITPCYHAISDEALQTWFATSETCPVCRSPCNYNQLYCWKI